MKFNEHEEKEFYMFVKEYVEHPKVQRMKSFSQHGRISTFEHCHRVARWCYGVSKRLGIRVNMSALLSGALLHDMFLYDWHTIGRMNRYHATNHAELACRNAARYCNIDEHAQDVIRSHMWPVNITKLPKTREAVLVCIGDKWCSLVETLVCRKGMTRHRKKR